MKVDSIQMVGGTIEDPVFGGTNNPRLQAGAVPTDPDDMVDKEYVDGKFKATPYDIAFSSSGKPTNGEVITSFLVPRSFQIKAGMAGSLAKVSVAPAANATFSLKKNGAEFATLLFAAAQTNGAFTCASDVSFAAGDTLSLVAPATADGALSDLMTTIVAGLQ